MIEAGVLDGGASIAPSETDEVTAGALLRQAREAAGLHAAALAVSLKVPVSKLEALEQDRHDLLPDAVFARGLAAAICRNLKIDARPILDRLPRTAVPRLVRDSEGLNAPFRSPRDGMAPNWREQLTRPVFIAVAVILVAALVVLLMPRTPLDDAAKAPDNAAVPFVPAPEIVGATAPSRADSPMVATSMSMPALARTAPAAAEPPAPGPAASAASPAPATATAPAAADGTVVFRASGAVWVEVRDAKGVVPIRKLMAAGESAAASGAMPLQVTVGKVDATEVQVRGKPFDLKPYARDNVARFEVK